MIEKSSSLDTFAAIATTLTVSGRDGMSLPSAAAHNGIRLPLTHGERPFPRPNAPKITTAAQLRDELTKLRERMQPFLQNLAPPMPTTRVLRPMEDFQWRIETPADRASFAAVLGGCGDWDVVRIPHYGPPLGVATTLYRTEFDLAEEIFSHERQVVCLDAVDYRCQVYLK